LTGRWGAPKLPAMAYDNFLIDKRIVERNIAKGLVEPEALKKQIDALPDREQNCIHVSLDGEAEGDDDVDLDDVDDDDDEDDDQV
jgi:hypothetical protein